MIFLVLYGIQNRGFIVLEADNKLRTKPVLRMDPYSFGCLGSGSVLGCRSGSRSMEIDQHFQIYLVSCLSKRLLYFRRYAFLTYYQVWIYFSCEILSFCDFKV
jgi:hypothetical protein